MSHSVQRFCFGVTCLQIFVLEVLFGNVVCDMCTFVSVMFGIAYMHYRLFSMAKAFDLGLLQG